MSKKDATTRMDDVYSFIATNFSTADEQNVKTAVAEKYGSGAQRDFVSNSLSLGNRGLFKKDKETQRRLAVRAVGLVSALVLGRDPDEEDVASIVANKRNYSLTTCLQELDTMLKTLRPQTKVAMERIGPQKFTQDPRLEASFRKANSMERKLAIDAVERASEILSRAWQAMLSVKRNMDIRGSYELYFGPFDDGRYNTVRTNLKTIHDVVCSQSLHLYYRTGKAVGEAQDVPGSGPGATIGQMVGTHNIDNIYAYVLNPPPGPGTHVFLCKLFFNNTHLQQREEDQIGGVFIHELSHHLCGTRDHAYGPANCQALDPADMVTNADNYEYFCEQFG